MFRFATKQSKIFFSIIRSISVNVMYFFRWFEIPAKLSFLHKPMLKNIFLFRAKRMIRFVNHNISIGSSYPAFECIISYACHHFFFIYTITSSRTILTSTFFKHRRFNIKNLFTNLTNSLYLSTIPKMIICSRKLRALLTFVPRDFSNLIFISTFIRTTFYSSYFYPIKSYIKFLFTNYTFYSFTSFWFHISFQIKRAAFGGLKRTVKSLHLLTAHILDTIKLFPSSNYSIPQNNLINKGVNYAC